MQAWHKACAESTLKGAVTVDQGSRVYVENLEITEPVKVWNGDCFWREGKKRRADWDSRWKKPSQTYGVADIPAYDDGL